MLGPSLRMRKKLEYPAPLGLVRLNKSSFSLALKLTLTLTICHKLFEKQSISLRKGC